MPTDRPSADNLSYQAIVTVLNSLDALVYVADMDTHELIFFNDYGRAVWGNPQNSKCWQVIQSGQAGPCDFCTNHRLVDDNGQPTGPLVWEFQNTANQRWYQCRDQAIRWIDGRLVRMEIATDITERKQMEQALDEARILAEKRADTDDLTGLSNRRAFFAQGAQTIRQAIRARTPVAVIMFDLDHFKSINDRWGHATGDSVLKGIADSARETVRDSDILARLGGEEFAVLLPDTTLAKARHLAERLQKTFAERVFSCRDKRFQCTASFGITASERPDMTLDDLLSEADRALFRAKDAGRNRVSGEA